MIKVFVTPIYEVQIDTMNYTVLKNAIYKTGKNVGKQTQTVLGYYQNMKPCLEKIAQDMIKSQETELGSLEQYKNLIDETMAYYLNELDKISERIEKEVKIK